MDVFIATENIKKFDALLRTEKGELQRYILLKLRGLEEKKLATAIAAQSDADTLAYSKSDGSWQLMLTSDTD